MAKFTNVNDLLKHVQQLAASSLANSANVERVVADEISQAVWDVVYTAYDPEFYERRGDEGGLSDVRNVEIVDFGVRDGQVFVRFENLTQGDDSLSTVFLTDTIEEGIKENWSNPDGPWSEPRAFMAEASRRLNENPGELKDAIRKSLIERGLKVK